MLEGVETLSVDALSVRGLKPISFALQSGDCLVVRGPSGSGKSLFLRAIADLDPVEGVIRLGETERSTMSGPEWRRKVRYLAAESGWWEERILDHFRDEAKARSLAVKLRLPGDLFTRPISQTSSGERQRLAFMRAIETKPPVLLLDEPTSALDEEAEAAMEAQIRKVLADGTIVVIVTHKSAQDERFATHRLTIEDGSVRFAAR